MLDGRDEGEEEMREKQEENERESINVENESRASTSHTHTQIQRMMQGHIDDLTDSKVIAVGDTLESALELGEKHEAFVTKCKEVRVGE